MADRRQWLVRFREATGSFKSRLLIEIQNWRKAYFFRRPWSMGLAAYAVLIVIFSTTGAMRKTAADDPDSWAPDKVCLTGVVKDFPDERPRACVFVVDVETIRTPRDRSPRSANGLVLLYVAKGGAEFARPGDRIEVWGSLQRPKNAALPGAFDYAEFLSNRNIRTVLYSGLTSARNLGYARRFFFTRIGWAVNQRITRAFQRWLSPEQAAVLSGLVVGRRPRFFPELKETFQKSGTMHILVASGSNVAGVVALWYLLVRLLTGLSRRRILAAALVPVWIYTMVVGFEAPIMRSAIMASVGIAAYMTAREDQLYHAWTMAALVILVSAPRNLFDLGFQMSFVTVFGLIYSLPHLRRLTASLPTALRWTAQVLCVTAVAQLWLVPITASSFKQFTLSGILANLFILPLSALSFLMGAALATFDALLSKTLLSNQFLYWLSRPAAAVLQLIIELARFFAKNPAKTIWFSSPGMLWNAGYFLALACVFKIRRSLLARSGLVLGIALLLCGHLRSERNTNRPTEVTWLKLGRQIGILVENRNQNLLVLPSAVTSDAVERLLMPFLATKGVGRLDNLLVVEQKKRSPETLRELLKNVDVTQRAVVCASSQAEWNAVSKGRNVDFLDEGDRKVWGELVIEVLPGSRVFGATPAILLTIGSNRFVIADGLPLVAQDHLLEKGPFRVDVLQTRYSPRVRWRDAFVAEFEPLALVDTAAGKALEESSYPWEIDVIVAPRILGWWSWNGSISGQPK